MRSPIRYSQPDLAVTKLSKPPCYNALFYSKILIYHTFSGVGDDFLPALREKRGARSLLGSG
jgi:hypothetical protein